MFDATFLEAATAVMKMLFISFSVVMTVIGIVGLMWLLAWLLQVAINQVFSVAACIEAANEAHKQGRAPILRAWMRRTGR